MEALAATTNNNGIPLDPATAAHIDQTAKEFEAMVIAQMLQPLFASVETPGLAGGGPGQEAFESMLQEQYAEAIAERGGYGIADQVKAAMIELQASSKTSSLQGPTK